MCSARSTSGCCKAYHGDAIDYDEQSRITWARIPHFYSTPYYVYQYATCFASSAQLMKQLDERRRRGARGGGRPLPDAAEVGRQRSSDGAAAARRRRSQPAGNRARRRRSARRARDAARERASARSNESRLLQACAAVSCGTRSIACVAPMHASITTIRPPAGARAAASSFTMPACSHNAFAPIFDRFVGDRQACLQAAGTRRRYRRRTGMSDQRRVGALAEHFRLARVDRNHAVADRLQLAA